MSPTLIVPLVVPVSFVNILISNMYRLNIDASVNTPLDEVPETLSMSLTLANPICPLAFAEPGVPATAS